MLREVAGLRVVTEPAFARLRLQHAGQQFQQRGFARAVRPDQHDALPALGLEIQIFVNEFGRAGLLLVLGALASRRRDAGAPRRGKLVTKLHVLQRDDAMAAALRLRETETHRRARRRRASRPCPP